MTPNWCRNESWTNPGIYIYGVIHLEEKEPMLWEESSWKKLKSLLFFSNSLDSREVAGLAENMSWTCLEDISLEFNNNIGDEGNLELSKSTQPDDSRSALFVPQFDSRFWCERARQEYNLDHSNNDYLIIIFVCIEKMLKIGKCTYWPYPKKIPYPRVRCLLSFSYNDLICIVFDIIFLKFS